MIQNKFNTVIFNVLVEKTFTIYKFLFCVHCTLYMCTFLVRHCDLVSPLPWIMCTCNRIAKVLIFQRQRLNSWVWVCPDIALQLKQLLLKTVTILNLLEIHLNLMCYLPLNKEIIYIVQCTLAYIEYNILDYYATKLNYVWLNVRAWVHLVTLITWGVG